MTNETTLLLDALNDASEKLVLIQGSVKTEQDAKALQQLMGFAVEYITQLNLILLKTPEEIMHDCFRVQLTFDAVGNFIEDIHELRHLHFQKLRGVGQ
ncbi:hypothetical protein P5704_027680 (plasmid) [Pseudomonas sp. FeN3W]|nr:hypothetical protein P5704_027680 [Pseudomonas sp. FeN3W]